uniref:(California timema) hypothetical protein n=1 Tax=Timema californicum TaxID=61474 RepID=A0A7R9JBS8_TIMCA|nr:unnamed protein product [Timema californicum]
MLKDRKKANRKKFTTTDEIAKKLEETGKKVEKPKKEKPPPISQVPGEGEEEQVHQVEEIHEEDEWREFEEEKKDYTGLKIGHLQINEGENNIGIGDDEEDQMEENEAGEMVMRRKVQSGPWKMVNPQSQAPATDVQEPQELREPVMEQFVPVATAQILVLVLVLNNHYCINMCRHARAPPSNWRDRQPLTQY